MKLAVSDRSIDRIGVTSEAAFSLKATGKAFRILSSGLYKDKILAIVREISCNAYDAHVANGNPGEPFAVHLPNALEPYFSIRDYGIGLSHDDVMTLYATYFESTKADSNAFIGALGLGSKSPFSYVDAFTVVSHFNGRKRSYACFINETECPVVTMIQDEPTTERNGIEVNIPVEKRADFATFRDRAQTVYTMFEPRPIVRGDSSFKIGDREVFLERRGAWRVFKKEERGYGMHSVAGQPKAVMGKIAYPIHADSIPNIPARLSRLLTANIEIDFALGDLEFTAGREELSYDQKVTIPALIARLEQVHTEITADLSKSLDDCKTEIDARRRYGELTRTSILQSLGVNVLRWKTIVIDTDYFRQPSTNFDADIHRITRHNYFNPVYSKLRKTKDETLDLQCGLLPKIFFKDTKTNTSARVRITEYMKSPAWQGIKHQFDQVILIEGDEKAIAQARALLPGITLLDAMDLPKPEAKVRTKVKFKVMDSDGVTNPACLQTTEIDLEDGGYYVLTANGNIKSGTTHTAFGLKWRSLVAAGRVPADMKVYVVPTSISAKIVTHGDWFDVQAWMEAEGQLALADPAIAKTIALGNAYKSLQAKIGDYAVSTVVKNWQALVPSLPATHLITHFVTLIESYQTDIKRGVAVTKLVEAFAATAPATPRSTDDDLVVLYERIMHTYPMFEFAPQKGYLGSTMREYTHMVDDYRALKANKLRVNP